MKGPRYTLQSVPGTAADGVVCRYSPAWPNPAQRRMECSAVSTARRRWDRDVKGKVGYADSAHVLSKFLQGRRQEQEGPRTKARHGRAAAGLATALASLFQGLAQSESGPLISCSLAERKSRRQPMDRTPSRVHTSGSWASSSRAPSPCLGLPVSSPRSDQSDQSASGSWASSRPP